MSWRTIYEARINSLAWRELKSDLVKWRGSKCERCELETTMLELHHLNYDRVGKELTSDLQLLCIPCHEIADKERAIIGRRRAYATRYKNGFNTYMDKKYGDNRIFGSSDDYREFDQWLEDKEKE